MGASVLTPEAHRQARLMAKAIVPLAARLEREFRAKLLERGYTRPQVRALAAVTPMAGARVGGLGQFLEQVDYYGCRLAKLNVPASAVTEELREFAASLDRALGGRFQPAREQLWLLTTLALERAYHAVREGEARAFFALYRAQIEAADMDELLERLGQIVVSTFHAAAGRVLLPAGRLSGALARPLYLEPGDRLESCIDERLRGRFASYWSYPLGSKAVVQLGFRRSYPWLPREIALIEALGMRCLEALERAQLEREIRRLEAKARGVEEAERRRIGRELHDEAGQSLLLLRLQLEMLEREAPEALRGRLGEARLVVENTVLELRRIVRALSPAVLERLGLASALRQLGARFRKTHAAALRLRISGSAEALNRETEEVIYRVVQECLQNVAKHSQATRVNLSFHKADKKLRLSVRDNGAGFRAETALARPMSFGLAGMAERAALLGGKLAVQSAPGKGTTVTLELPRQTAGVAPYVKNSHSTH